MQLSWKGKIRVAAERFDVFRALFAIFAFSFDISDGFPLIEQFSNTFCRSMKIPIRLTNILSSLSHPLTLPLFSLYRHARIYVSKL